jgi:hypothetical protein
VNTNRSRRYDLRIGRFYCVRNYFGITNGMTKVVVAAVA